MFLDVVYSATADANRNLQSYTKDSLFRLPPLWILKSANARPARCWTSRR